MQQNACQWIRTNVHRFFTVTGATVEVEFWKRNQSKSPNCQPKKKHIALLSGIPSQSLGTVSNTSSYNHYQS